MDNVGLRGARKIALKKIGNFHLDKHIDDTFSPEKSQFPLLIFTDGDVSNKESD